MARAAEADVFQGAFRAPRMDPKRKNALVDFSQLPGAGQHPAAVHKNRQIERLGIFTRQDLRRALRAAIQRERRFRRKILGHTFAAQTRRLRAGARREPAALQTDRNCREPVDRVNPAGAQHQEPAPPLPRQLQQVGGADQIMLDELPAAGFAVHARQHAGIGGGIQDPVAGRERFQIARVANIPVNQPDSAPAKRGPVQFAAGAHEVVQADEFPIRPPRFQPSGQGAADEPAGACD